MYKPFRGPKRSYLDQVKVQMEQQEDDIQYLELEEKQRILSDENKTEDEPRLETTPTTSKSKKSSLMGSLIVVYMTVFIDLLGFGIIIPLLPYYALHLGKFLISSER